MRQAIDITKKQEAIKWIGEQGGGVASRAAPHFRKLGLIDEWERSDNVEYIARGTPRPPSVETVCNWVRTAWRETLTSVVLNSIEAAGFHQSPSRWSIWNHDVYVW
ncbi:hypothetical protein PPTG_09795 [Phytophthora nicotianae INRA-310]|uniref:DDE-1 domain-containing protein n=1 Tax=Phytophthora nicotianae (strain INRA-310) TaxID=761204 RepID=W2QCV2_PHYN3|nr:hypothetical protein PPTG_09795 [Phytophthora nicotianae INRA-310]ETN10701.1 hypothetical protein PPTG_09795 [Phytophthora nicotianae INRA-310]